MPSVQAFGALRRTPPGAARPPSKQSNYFERDYMSKTKKQQAKYPEIVGTRRGTNNFYLRLSNGTTLRFTPDDVDINEVEISEIN
jgi:hypothetical protein